MKAKTKWISLLASGAFAAMLAAACSSSSSSGGACQAGDQQACNCADGSHSFAACVNGAFAACQCSAANDGGNNDSGGSSDGGAESGQHEGGPAKVDAGFGEYLGPCAQNTDCPPGDICFQFGTKGMRCTKTCTSSADCPAPSPGCNPKMVCAVPD